MQLFLLHRDAEINSVANQSFIKAIPSATNCDQASRKVEAETSI